MQLNDNQLDRLSALVEDDLAMNSLRTLAHIITEEAKPDPSSGGDLEIGQRYRAYGTAKGMFDTFFGSLDSFKKLKPDDETPNAGI
jgi:hypothetical protein